MASMNNQTLTQLRNRNAEYQRKWRSRQTPEQRKRYDQAKRMRKARNAVNWQNDNQINKTDNNFIYTCFWPKCERTFNCNFSLLCHLMTFHKKLNDSVDNTNSSDSIHVKLIRIINSEFANDFSINTIAKESGEQIHECDKCGQKFENVHQLNDHTIIHIDKPFKCDFCDNRYNSINELLIHRDGMHFNNKCFALQCDECSYKSIDQYNLRAHQRRVHKKEKNFICEQSECNGKAFFSIHGLNQHRKVHSNQRFHCTWTGCGSSFKCPDYLNKHLKWHSGESRFQCDYEECNGKIFSSKNALSVHKQCIHSDEKPFECYWPECSARFKMIGQLNFHIKGVHHKPDVNERKFNCTDCDYSAITKQSIYIHRRRVHQKLKKFICDVSECNGRSFYSKHELELHKNSIHSDKRPFVCDWPQCNSAFKLEHNLRVHIKKVHNRI